MPFLARIVAAAAAALAIQSAAAGPIGPQAYGSQADSPFNPASFGYFYLEDLEAGAVFTPGIAVWGSGFCIVGASCFVGAGLTDSVGNGGNGLLGRSIYADDILTIAFDSTAPGGLPTAAGLVWTDGSGTVTFRAFDAADVLIAEIKGDHADGSFAGTLADDRFYGVTHAAGIARMTIGTGSGIEIDHVQYGGGTPVVAPVPAPTTLALLGLGVAALGSRLRRRA